MRIYRSVSILVLVLAVLFQSIPVTSAMRPDPVTHYVFTGTFTAESRVKYHSLYVADDQTFLTVDCVATNSRAVGFNLMASAGPFIGGGPCGPDIYYFYLPQAGMYTFEVLNITPFEYSYTLTVDVDRYYCLDTIDCTPPLPES